MDEHAGITAIQKTVSTSRPHDKNTTSQITHPCKRVVDSRIRQHFPITPGNSSQKTTFNLIGQLQPNQKRWNLPDQVYASPQQAIL